MKKMLYLSLSLIFLSFFVSFAQVTDIPDNDKQVNEDKTLSPYFVVKSDNPNIDVMPLLSTSADVTIAGVIADVTVKQVYKNSGKVPLEAIYVFPASTRAAVYGMTMTIGERILKAEIKEKKEARNIYEKAKKEGKSASLLEQSRPNVFTMNVANIMPGDSIVVELKYTELLIPENKEYKFVYPTVVGPRYSNTQKDSAKDSEKFVETPYQHEGEKPSYTFDIKINLNTAVPLQDVECKSHKVDIDKESDYKTIIELDKSEEYSGNKDFILKYSLSGNKIETGLLLSENGKEKFFLMMLQPPKRVDISEIPPREYIFILDVSGSMYGFPLDVSKKLMNEIFRNLRPIDKFNILFFAGGSQMLFSKSRPANPENLDSASKMFDRKRGGGGTELLPAMKRALSIPKDENYSRSFVIVTDGYVSVEKETFDLIRKNLNNTNVFAFGIGSSVNRFLIEGIARAGMGQPFFVTNTKEAEPVSKKLIEYIKSPIMTDIKVEFNGFLAEDVEPSSIPDVFADRPIIVYGKWEDQADGFIKVSGKIKGKEYHVDINVQKFGRMIQGDALKYLWARNKIAQLADYASVDVEAENKREITNLGLKYNLLTNYTSFVAVDYIKRNGKDSIVSVKQPLPLPEGVSDHAVGGALYRTSGMGMAMPLVPERRRTNMSLNGAKFNSVDNKEPGINDFIPVDQPPLVNMDELRRNIIYTGILRIACIEGKVLIRVLVDTLGKVTKYKIEYSDNTLLDSAAINAVRKTKFTPAIKDGKPILAWVTIPINFKYRDLERFKIKDIKLGKGKIIKKGDRISFNYIIYSNKSYLNTNEIKNSYKQGRAFVYRYEKDKKYDILNSWFKGMKVGGKREIAIPKKYQKKIEKIFKLNSNKDYLLFEIELVKTR